MQLVSSQDNAAMESFWSIMQRELLDLRSWPNSVELAAVMFKSIESSYSTRRRHCGIRMLSSHEFETLAVSTTHST